MDDEVEMEKNALLFNELAIHPFHRRGFTAYIVVLPRPAFSPECYFAAIVYKDAEPREYGRTCKSIRYFTLEKTDTGSEPLLCEWYRDGTRKNHQVALGPNPKVFAEAVFERL